MAKTEVERLIISDRRLRIGAMDVVCGEGWNWEVHSGNTAVLDCVAESVEDLLFLKVRDAKYFIISCLESLCRYVTWQIYTWYVVIWITLQTS